MTLTESMGGPASSTEVLENGGRPDAAFDRYVVIELLGQGSMGRVYRARDTELGRDVALKWISPGRIDPAQAKARLRREAQAMAKVEHAAVVRIYDVGISLGRLFVTMELARGGTLAEWLKARPRGWREVIRMFIEAGRGLSAAHHAGLVHRDVKPGNILVDASGRAKVSDFGLARSFDYDDAEPEAEGLLRELVDVSLTRPGAIVGTLAYMAPEQLRGDAIDTRADQFGFCVALWEALCGRRPFRVADDGAPAPEARLHAIVTGSIDDAAAGRRVPRRILTLVRRGLAAERDRRWTSMDELLNALERACRTRRTWWVTAAALLGGGALVAAATRGGAGSIGVLRGLAAPAPVSAVLPAVPLVHDRDLKAAAISPDGTKLALITGDSLVIRGSEIGAEGRIVIAHGVDAPIAWSPDSRHLLVGTVPELAPVIQMELVAIEDGVRRKVPVTGFGAFLSNTEMAITSYRQRTVTILPLGDPAIGATCQVPGEYRFLMKLAGLPDGTMVIETEALDSERHFLVILGRDCAVRARFEEESISGFAVTDAETIVALLVHDKFPHEILEISLGGKIVSRRQVSAVLGGVLGRRHGIDYVTTVAPRTELVRVHAQNGASQQVLSLQGTASFRLAPDGENLAWIERDNREKPLWVSTLQHIARSQVLLHNAWSADWSPDGRSLAVLVDDRAAGTKEPHHRATTSLVIIDRSGQELKRMQIDHIYRESAPVWLDDRRIAVRTDDRSTYRQIDLNNGDQRQIFDSEHGATCLLIRSPHDGTLAMWRNGPPGAIDASTDHLWIKRLGHAAGALHVKEAIRHFLSPSWSRSGELLVRAPDGVVSWVALDTGELTPFAKLPPQPLSYRYDDHVMPLSSGDLLAVNHELGTNVAVVRPDEPVMRPSDE